MQDHSVIHLLFICTLCHDPGQADAESCQSRVWQACADKNVSGLFVRCPKGFIGYLEGPEKQVFSVVERMIRSAVFENLEVVHEHSAPFCLLEGFACAATLADLTQDQIQKVPGLAQLVVHTLNAD